MKKIITLFLIAGALSLQAQITINLGTVNTAEAEISTTVSNASIVDTTTKGANVTWNYGSLSPVTADTTFYFDPSDGPYMGDTAFPTAAVGTVTGVNSTNFTYLSYEANTYKLIGMFEAADSSVIKWNPGFVYFPATIAYNDVLNSASSASMYMEMSGIPLRIDITLERKSTVDAWGKLTTPAGTFDVLRVKNNQKSIMAAYMFMGVWAPAGTPETDYSVDFVWLNAQGNEMLSVAYNADIADMEGDYYVKSIPYSYVYNNPGIGIAEVTADNKEISIYPNPVSDFITINNDKAEALNVKIFNATGSLVNNFQVDQKNAVVSLAHLQSGMYFYQVENNGSIVKAKNFIKK